MDLFDIAVASKLAGGGGGVTPTGNCNITSTAQTDVSAYATAQVVDADLVASNIKKDVDILGVVGTYEGGGGIVPLVDETMSISTTSTSTANVKTYETSLSALGGKTLHMRVYDTNGIRTDYFYSYDQIYANTPNGGYALLASIACFDSGGNFSTRYESPTDNQYGVFFSCSSIVAQDKLQIYVQKRYNSTKTKTINGKFRVLIFVL